MSYKKYFITFANEKFEGALKRITRQISLMNVFDVIRPYTDKDLESFTDFWDRHGEFVKNNPKGHGYWIWKSYLTLKTLVINYQKILSGDTKKIIIFRLFTLQSS
jgi:hypothetical protein